MHDSNIKAVGGFVVPDEKGVLTIPPTQALEIGINGKNDWMEIPLARGRKRDYKTER